MLCDLGPHCVLQSSHEALTTVLPLRLRNSPQGARVREEGPACHWGQGGTGSHFPQSQRLGACPLVPWSQRLGACPVVLSHVRSLSVEPAAQPPPPQASSLRPQRLCSAPYSARSAPPPSLSRFCRRVEDFLRKTNGLIQLEDDKS